MATARLNSRWIALLVASGVIFYLCWLMMRPFVDVLLWAVVLGMVSYPAFGWLVGRGRSRHAAAMMTTGLVVLVILLPLALVATAVVRQGAGAVDAVQDGVSKLLDPNSGLMRWVGKYVDVGPLLDRRALAERFGAAGSVVAARTVGIVGGVIGVVVQAFFVLFTLYYLLRDSDRILPAVHRMLPLPEKEAELIFSRTRDVISASVTGVLVIAAIQGLLGMAAFLFLGLRSAVLWGVVMFLASTIPMLGAAIVWVPAAIYLAVTGHWVKAIILTAWGALVIGLIDNVLRPRLVGKRARLHELVIFFSVLGGLQVFGVLGLFVGPVVAAIALALVDVFGRMNETDRVEQGVEAAVAGIAAVPAGEVVAAQTVAAGPVTPPVGEVKETHDA